MDLRYSREDEAFRAEIRAWLAVEVPAHGPPPPTDDWPARRAYDTAWQRKLFDAGLAGLAWPSECGGRGLPITQQLVYFEEYARAGAPYIGVGFVGLMHAGPTLIAEGSDAQRAFHLPRILKGESGIALGHPSLGVALGELRWDTHHYPSSADVLRCVGLGVLRARGCCVGECCARARWDIHHYRLIRRWAQRGPARRGDQQRRS